MRELFRPTTDLHGPGSLQRRDLAVILVCWLLWYLAASYALGALVPRLAPQSRP